MTKSEFLEKLRAALGNDLSGSVIQENVAYYDSYISGEARNGRPEEDVIAELGDPWVIAQTIIDSEEVKRAGQNQKSYTYEPERQSYSEDTQSGRVYSFGLDTWWKKLLLVLGIIGVIVVVVSIVGGIISLLAPVIIPLVVIMLVIRLIGSRR